MPEVEIHPLLCVLAAYIISSVMSVGGISGAFLLLPFQVSVLGFTGPAVTPTNHLFNVVAIPSGVYRYWREKRMLWQLAGVIAAGTVPGAILGSLIRLYLLSTPRTFKMFVGSVLILVAGRLVHKLIRARSAVVTEDEATFGIEAVRLQRRRLEYTFQGKSHGVPLPQLIIMTAIVGVIGGAYGIGGGAIIAPLLVALWSLPVQSISGAALFGTCLTSIVGVAFFWLMGVTGAAQNIQPNWPLGLSFGFGGLLGTYTGARIQRFLPARAIEALLALVMTGIGLSYVLGS